MKIPKTARGRKTRDKLLQAAEIEFGEKGFHAASISEITRRAQVALGSFYTYFDSKEAIFEALVAYMSDHARAWIAERVEDAPDRPSAERLGMEAFIEYVRAHKGIYRIITEAEFIANDAFRTHYERFSGAYRTNLENAADKGEIRRGDFETWSWAIIGMAVFLGMRYAAWDDDTPAAQIADTVTELIFEGIGKPSRA